MGLLELIGFAAVPRYNTELPELYPLAVKLDYFVKADLFNIYSKILTDCVERTQGIPEKYDQAFWDNCLASEANKGLITLLAYAMVEMSDLFLVYQAGVLRIADRTEQSRIKEDYERSGSSSYGVYLSFKHYDRTCVLKIYSALEYCVLSSLNTTMNVAKSVQVKIAKMRETIGAIDKDVAITQAKAIAEGLKEGRSVMLDSEDTVEHAQIDMDPTEKAMTFIDSKRAFYLGLPLSYITGEQTGGIGSTGEGDSKAIERGLKSYWRSILKPAVSALFGVENISFKSQDFRQIDSALNAVRTFELISDDLITLDMKRLIVSKMLDIDAKDMPKGEPAPEVVVDTVRPNQTA